MTMHRWHALPLCTIGVALAMQTVGAAGATFSLDSAALRDGGTLPMAFVNDQHGCTGANHSPPLAWQGAPAGTRSFALSIHDIDARGGQGWWHWIVAGIPANVHALPENASGAVLTSLHAHEGRNDFGQTGYGGACPPIGDAPHHYVITIYALGNDAGALDMAQPPAQLARTIEAGALAHASLSVTYGRPAH